MLSNFNSFLPNHYKKTFKKVDISLFYLILLHKELENNDTNLKKQT